MPLSGRVSAPDWIHINVYPDQGRLLAIPKALERQNQLLHSTSPPNPPKPALVNFSPAKTLGPGHGSRRHILRVLDLPLNTNFGPREPAGQPVPEDLPLETAFDSRNWFPTADRSGSFFLYWISLQTRRSALGKPLHCSEEDRTCPAAATTPPNLTRPVLAAPFSAE